MIRPSRTREGCCARQDEETWYSLHGFDGAGDEGGRAFGDGVVDADSRSFVEDLDAEDLGGAHRAVFVGAGERDVEGQDLVGVHRGGQFVQAVDVRHLGVELVDGVTNRLAWGTRTTLRTMLEANRALASGASSENCGRMSSVSAT